MATHPVFLLNRTQATLAITYPTALLAGEQVIYDAGGFARFPLQVRVNKSAAGGQNITLKLQAAPISVDGANYAARGPGGEQGLLQVFGVTGELYTAQLEQQTGLNVPYASTLTGGTTDLKLLLKLPTDVSGRPSGTPASAAAYINTLVDFAAVSSGVAAATAVLGPTLDNRRAPRIHWNDVESSLQGTVAVEHVLNAPAGGLLDVALVALVPNFSALRALPKSAAAPGLDDAIKVLAALEGA